MTIGIMVIGIPLPFFSYGGSSLIAFTVLLLGRRPPRRGEAGAVDMIHEHRNTRMRNRNLYVLTGGPGGGKSTVLDILDGMGYHTVREAGRKIIRSRQNRRECRPWADTARYARLMSLQSRNDFEKHADLGEPCFFDRGIVDVWGYCRLIGLPVFRELKNAAEKCLYNERVFLFPFWEEIYVNDSERKQSPDEARETCRILKDTYERLRLPHHNRTFPAARRTGPDG